MEHFKRRQLIADAYPNKADGQFGPVTVEFIIEEEKTSLITQLITLQSLVYFEIRADNKQMWLKISGFRAGIGNSIPVSDNVGT